MTVLDAINYEFYSVDLICMRKMFSLEEAKIALDSEVPVIARGTITNDCFIATVTSIDLDFQRFTTVSGKVYNILPRTKLKHMSQKIKAFDEDCVISEINFEDFEYFESEKPHEVTKDFEVAANWIEKSKKVKMVVKHQSKHDRKYDFTTSNLLRIDKEEKMILTSSRSIFQVK